MICWNDHSRRRLFANAAMAASRVAAYPARGRASPLSGGWSAMVFVPSYVRRSDRLWQL